MFFLQFYTRILTSFVESWFSLLSNDDDFITALKENLREVTCRLIHKIKDVIIFIFVYMEYIFYFTKYNIIDIFLFTVECTIINNK